jgi:pimeloyl-ACP methyl ester carboxylesterase
MAAQIESRFVEANDLNHHYLTAGSGPAVLLCHGFPELSWSWRHQIPALATAGYRVIAPDMRGYGDTKGPADPEAYTNLHAIGDIIKSVVPDLRGTVMVDAGHWVQQEDPDAVSNGLIEFPKAL